MRRRFMTALFAIVCLLPVGQLVQAQTGNVSWKLSIGAPGDLTPGKSRNIFRNSVDAWSRRANANYGANENITVTTTDFNSSVRRLARFF
jgi:hypothetical protein